MSLLGNPRTDALDFVGHTRRQLRRAVVRLQDAIALDEMGFSPDPAELRTVARRLRWALNYLGDVQKNLEKLEPKEASDHAPGH